MKDRNTRHKQTMQRKKAHIDNKVAQATEERGIIILLTGNGKGKSSSALGTIIRSLGYGFKVGLAQFIKGSWETGEDRFLKDQPLLEQHMMGTGFTWETQDREKDIAAAQVLWSKAQKMLQNESLHLLVLDEITYMFTYGYLDISTVLTAIQNRPPMQNLILTGRNASQTLIDVADTVSEIKDTKHAFNSGVKAQQGIEY